jgi:hypothetical protein
VGIAIGFVPDLDNRGMFLQALYKSKEDWSIETHCIVKAAGPAADLLHSGTFTEESARGDLKDIKALTGIASLEPYLEKARAILTQYPNQRTCVASLLRGCLEEVNERSMGILPGGRLGALLLDEAQLKKCFPTGM